MIGVFDSGYGGLTVLREIVKKLPEYDYIYLGDNARAPYGNRSFETIYNYTLQCVSELFDRGCSVVILACNTASAKALRSIQQNDLKRIAPNKKVLGVIVPTIESIGSFSKNYNIGVLATSGTVSSNSYPIEILKSYPNAKVYQEACPMWVPLIENNEFNNSGADFFIQKNITNLLRQNNDIDCIILGCTHYPLIKNKIEKYVSPKIKILSQGEIVAESLKDYLNRHPEIDTQCSKKSSINFLTTDSAEIFSQNAHIFLGKYIIAEKIVLKSLP